VTNSAPPGTPAATARLACHAQRAARAAITHTILRAAPEASAAEAVHIARELELAVYAEVRGRIRRAREAGESWAAVGAMLRLGPVAAQGPGTLAELAFDYTAGARTLLAWYPDRPLFWWDCPVCGQRIADHGPGAGPISDQDGHADGCARLAAEDSEWEQETPR
jgi:hypothetical protein